MQIITLTGLRKAIEVRLFVGINLMDHDRRNRVQLHFAELNKSNLKFNGPFNKAFWACERFSGIGFKGSTDVCAIRFRFLECDSQQHKLDLKLSVQATMKGGIFREQFRI